MLSGSITVHGSIDGQFTKDGDCDGHNNDSLGSRSIINIIKKSYEFIHEEFSFNVQKKNDYTYSLN